VRLLLVVLSLTSLLAHADPLLVDRIVAVVDLQAITRSAVEQRAQPALASAKTAEQRTQARRDALTDLIEDALISREARRLRLEVKDEEVESAFAAVARQNQLSTDELVAETKRQGIDVDQYRAMLKRKILELKWLNARLNRAAMPESDAERGAFYSSERQRLMTELRAAAVIEVRP
jgi:peptidyl-prolyl cis-trans isomerase SurA